MAIFLKFVFGKTGAKNPQNKFIVIIKSQILILKLVKLPFFLKLMKNR